MSGKIYFAHPISMYGTAEEAAIVAALKSGGYEVENPSDPVHAQAVPKIRAQFSDAAAGSAAVMQYFVGICNACEAVAFSPFPDGSIGAGVVKEVQSFLDRGAPAHVVVSENGHVSLRQAESLDEFRCLSVEETRSMLRQLGAAGYTFPARKP